MLNDAGGREPWRRTLYVMWVADFIAVGGISLAIPFLPLYLKELGVTDDAAAQRWSGLIVSANFLCAAVMSPIWGSLSDRYGRKPMALRAIVGLSFSIGLMAFATRPEHLLILRLLQGAVGGFVSASVALVASAVPKEKLGATLGTLQTALTAGNVIGPLLGGRLADWFGYSHVFLITGGLCLVAAAVVALFVREEFTPVSAAERHGLRDNLVLLRSLPALHATFGVMFLTQVGFMVVQPVLPLLLRDLAGSDHLLRTKVGFVFSMPGVAAVIAAPLWGRQGDRIGYRFTLALALLGAGLCYLPQALAHSIAALAAMRFALGLFSAGVSPSASSVVASSVEESRTASALALLATAQWTGNVCGPLMGGFLSAHLGIQPVFVITGVLLLLSGGLALRVARSQKALVAHEPVTSPVCRR
ncbi:MAG: MFS transporter [Armatimonadota bacterium]|nr:MFS transporter [Armatimonadota bacterium]